MSCNDHHCPGAHACDGIDSVGVGGMGGGHGGACNLVSDVPIMTINPFCLVFVTNGAIHSCQKMPQALSYCYWCADKTSDFWYSMHNILCHMM